MVKTEDLWEIYKRTRSVWRTAEEVGLVGQTVHERLKNHGYKLYGEKFSPEEDEMIRQAYALSSGSKGLDLRNLAIALGRPHHTNVARRARILGLTDRRRKHTQAQKDAHSTRMLLAMQHGVFRRSYSNIEKGWYKSLSGKKYYLKSGWETKYAIYLDVLLKSKAIRSWEYEPDTFWFEKIRRGVRSYTPDFKIVFNDGVVHYHEVKGWLDAKSKTKLKRMRIYHPKVELVLIGKPELKALGLI